jgi:replication-associated recombination protein RarA
MKKKKEVIGQEKLIDQLELIIKAFKASEGEIKPHFILTGPSGNGKTETIQYLSQKYELSMVELNAAGLTKEGLSGNSVSKALAPLKSFQNRLVIAFVDKNLSLLL